MNIFGLFKSERTPPSIPKQDSWTVSWEVKQGWGGETTTRIKVFVDYDEAKEFKRKIDECGDIMQCYVDPSIKKN